MKIERFDTRHTARRRAISTAKNVLWVIVLMLVGIVAIVGIVVGAQLLGALAEGKAFAAENEALTEVSALKDEIGSLEYRLDVAEGLFIAGLPSRTGEVVKPTRELSAEERDLLERVVAAEARGEPYDGIVAVAEVVLNRSELWGMTVTEVLSAKGQFASPYEGAVSDAVKTAVTDARAGIRVFDVPVTHFHEAGITPYWAAGKTFAGQIGNHKFYY